MADKELQTILSSGDITSIYIGGVTAAEKAQTANDVLAITDPLNVRVTAIEASHTILITAKSLASIQQPTVADTPLQVEFGALQTTADIDLSALGAFTFKTAGKYIIAPFFQYGRAGSIGTSFLLNRYLVNGSQIGNSLAAKVDSADILVPWSSSIQFTAAVNDVLTIELMRDSTGNNSGGLFSATPAVVGWAEAPCASIQIYKAT